MQEIRRIRQIWEDLKINESYLHRDVERVGKGRSAAHSLLKAIPKDFPVRIDGAMV